MSCGWRTGLTSDEWARRWQALPEHVRQQFHQHAPLLSPDLDDDAAWAGLCHAVIAAEAALEVREGDDG